MNRAQQRAIPGVRGHDPRDREVEPTHSIPGSNRGATGDRCRPSARWMPVALVGCLAWFALASAGCGGAGTDEELRPRVAVSNSYLEAAVQDLLGDRVALLRLAEPGSCPGHFDLRPSQVRQLRDCQLLFRFDFQEGLDARAQGAGGRGPRIGVVTPSGGLGLPNTYWDVCRQTGAALTEAGLMTSSELEAALDRIERRLDQLRQATHAQIEAAGWRGRPVVTSIRQEAFATWLGLDVAAQFRATDAARPGEIDRAIEMGSQSNARLVIANEPEGTRLAEALAARLKVGLIVWANFPETGSSGPAFDRMIQVNAQRLVSVAL